jgi:hypothetical protein
VLKHLECANLTYQVRANMALNANILAPALQAHHLPTSIPIRGARPGRCRALPDAQRMRVF